MKLIKSVLKKESEELEQQTLENFSISSHSILESNMEKNKVNNNI